MAIAHRLENSVPSLLSTLKKFYVTSIPWVYIGFLAPKYHQRVSHHICRQFYSPSTMNHSLLSCHDLCHALCNDENALNGINSPLMEHHVLGIECCSRWGTLQCTNDPLHPHELQHVQLLQQLTLALPTSNSPNNTSARAFDHSAAFANQGAVEETQQESLAAQTLASLVLSPSTRDEFARSQCTQFSVFQRHGRQRAQMWNNEFAHTQEAKRQLPNDNDDDDSTSSDGCQSSEKRRKVSLDVHSSAVAGTENRIHELAFACDIESSRE